LYRSSATLKSQKAKRGNSVDRINANPTSSTGIQQGKALYPKEGVFIEDLSKIYCYEKSYYL
jgi:hypothetical protein